MYPLLRLLKILLKPTKSSQKNPFGTTEITFRCRPWDLDLFMEMNNGRQLTLYDLGRFDSIKKAGFTKVMRQNGWSVVVAGSSIRYRKRIRLFDKVTMKTTVVGMNERFLYVAQSMWTNGEPASAVILRTGVTRKGGLVPNSEVIEAFDPGPVPDLPDWVVKWEESDKLRPWPPNSQHD